MLERIARKLLYSRWFRSLLGWTKRIVFPGFEGFDLYQILRFFLSALAQGRLITRASAIAFQLFLAFFPAVIVLLTLIPFIPIPDFQTRLLDTFREMMPVEVFHFIESTLHDLLVKKHGTLLSISFVTGLYLASNSINAILEGFSGSTNLTRWHSAVKQRLLSLGLLLAITILLVIAIPVFSISDLILSRLLELSILTTSFEVYVLIATKWILTILLVMTSVSLLYTAGDPTAKRFRAFTPGSILAVFLILLVSQGLAFVFSNITDYNALYGSIGAILAVQLWIYFNMIALLVGYELNISIARARGQRSGKLVARR
ncbi:MAG: YihY/virulence factor BrkB family protein [Flavobacteriales bacterium]|jgi:membrane protein|nr:YihY/virulence factor BrkB family protein [Flavobacteriales bacterium]MBK9514142.1 YihY/virulence factor BrkB family protein [Flavobacteriales bacterium]MBP7449500.1 YihY/virulence factor BrkB family protein [Flavobacteriales bacterium]HOZ40768.1 YihY/virulence factor BrkB family protein [Flavobacteriales bacterium]